MTGGFRLGHEFLDALVKRAFGHQVRTRAIGAARVVQRRPFANDSRNIKTYSNFGAAHSSSFSNQGKTASAISGKLAEAAKVFVCIPMRGLIQNITTCSRSVCVFDDRP